MLAYFKLITSCILFGSVGLFIKNIPLSSGEIVLVRTTIGGLFLTAIALLKREKVDKKALKENFGRLILAGFLLGTNWTLLYETYNYTSVSVATLLHYLAPVVVMILSPIVLGEEITKPKLLGISATLIGMILVSGKLSSDGGNLKMALLCGIGSAVLYGALIVVNKTIEGVSGIIMTIFQLFIAAIIMFIYTRVTISQAFVIPTGIGLISLLIISFIHTGIGEYFYISSMQDLSAQTVGLLSYIDPLAALIFSAIFLGERLIPIQIIGGVLILGGAAYGELSDNKKQVTEV